MRDGSIAYHDHVITLVLYMTKPLIFCLGLPLTHFIYHPQGTTNTTMVRDNYALLRLLLSRLTTTMHFLRRPPSSLPLA
jgi:hypothetical protein